MDGQWETVVRNKKPKQISSTNDNGNVKTDKKANLIFPSYPKIEDVLSGRQIKQLYSNTDNKKDNIKKPMVPNNSTNKTQKTSKQQVQQQQQQKGQIKQNILTSRKKARNVDEAFGMFDNNECELTLESLKTKFPDSHLVWLKSIAAYLNEKLSIETDPIFQGKSHLYPSNICPSSLKELLYHLFEDAGPVNIQYFYDQLLTNLVVDLAKNVNCFGYKLILQLIANEWPTVCIGNLAKYAILRNSYQNRSTICQTLLWAVGQGGYHNLTVGIKVWTNLMLPLMEMKSYSKFVCEYINKISIKASETTLSLATVDFFTFYDLMMDLIFHSDLNNENKGLLTTSITNILVKFISRSSNCNPIFSNLFLKLNEENLAILYPGFVECIEMSPESIMLVNKLFKKNSIGMRILLKELDNNWETLSFNVQRNIQNFLIIHRISLENLIGKKNSDYDIAMEYSQNMQEKSTVKKSTSKSSSFFPWLFGSCLLLIIIGGVIAYDTHIHGGVFAQSATGQFLKQTGALPYVELVWTKTMSTSARGYQYAEREIPVYINKFRTLLKPYCDFSHDLFKITWHGLKNGFHTFKSFLLNKCNEGAKFIDIYVPGLPKKVVEFTSSIGNSLCNALTFIYKNGSEFFKTKVFVGCLSPASLSKALNDTQVVAARYYSWFHEKVDTYAKIE